MIVFGARSIVLLLGVVQGVVVAGLLLANVRVNRAANAFLAALLVALSLRMLPYVLGFAGAYGVWPWLSFAPFDIALVYGPLLWVFVVALTTGRTPATWRVHLIPALVQFAYYALVFVQPLAFKNGWDARVQVPFVVPFETLADAVSMTAYWIATWQTYRAYQRALDAQMSNRDAFRLIWLRDVLIALAVAIAVFWLLALTGAVHPLSYAQRFPGYVYLAIVVYVLGLQGWRHAAVAYPSVVPPVEVVLAAPDSSAAVDFAAEIERRGLWRDPDMTLASAATALGVGTATLSRALNAGLGQNFNAAINRMRVVGVQSELAAGATASLLDLAFAAGFASKASFNRAFKTYAGVTPTEYRRSVGAQRLIIAPHDAIS